ncbi:TPA: hypothetical protein HA249_01100 [Candidatus Woesearchaeota archaeon]|nr:hypothetical protein [Candidatus Woesearchaeota archaeon]HIH47234.1 hypothetical protein [Candidatus Woesearchaeota archaeon]HII88067.1 hypothetical protein [Candidatus Woesearchaeota archaeon]
MRAVQGLRSALALPLRRDLEPVSGEPVDITDILADTIPDELVIPPPGYEPVERVFESDPIILAELLLYELQTSRFAPDTFVGAVLEAREGERSYELRFGRDNRGPHITLSTENDAEGLEALAFAVRAKTGGYFAVYPVQGAVVRDRKGLFTTLYLVTQGHDFTDRNNPNMKARIEAAENPAVYQRWVETFEYWNPKKARKDFRANGKPRPEGLTSRFIHPRVYMPEPIALSQNNVAVVIDYLVGLGFAMKINQVDYALTRSEREHSSFVQDLRVR